ncbi:MAG: response regulator [Chloroflexota bacterium]
MNDPVSILVVDDNPPMVQTLQDILRVKGYAVHAAHSGAEALEILQRQKVDILLTDVVMPDMDGVALYRQVKESHPRLVTFLMTAYSADELIRQGMAEGIKTVLTKPLDLNLFLALVQAVDMAYFHRP